MKSGGGERKIRSDKKIDVKPTVSLELKKQIYAFSYLSDEPVKDVAERLILEGLMSKLVIDDICKWFRRNYYYNNVIAVGHPERPKLKIKYSGVTGKVSIKFLKEDYDILCELAHALDVTPTTAAGIIIKVAIRNIDFMKNYIQTFLRHLSDDRLGKIDSLLKAIWGFENRRVR